MIYKNKLIEINKKSVIILTSATGFIKSKQLESAKSLLKNRKSISVLFKLIHYFKTMSFSLNTIRNFFDLSLALISCRIAILPLLSKPSIDTLILNIKITY